VGDGVSAGVAVAEGDADGVGVGDPFLRFDFGVVAGLGDGVGEAFFFFGEGVGDGVGEIFFCFGEAEGDGLGVGLFADRFRCFRAGLGVGVGSKIFLSVLPNGSSAASATRTVPNKIATSKSHFTKSKLATLMLRTFQRVVIPSTVEESLILLPLRWRGQRCLHFGRHDTMPALGEWPC
jgi:hypothetical protein